MAKKLSIAILLAILLFSWNSLFATDFSSTNFIIKDPVIEPGAGFSTSNNFQLWGSMGQAAIGTSTATSFGLKSGFMYFLSSPTAPSGLNAVAASQTQINLSWTDNSSNEDGFKIERKTGSGGTYSQIATVLINVASYSDTGLSASTNYYYRVRAYNSAGNSGYSNEANATTLSPSAPLVGGGGGGGGIGIIPAKVIFRGKAYPQSYITLLKDAQTAKVAKAEADASFDITLSDVVAGTYTFGIWAEDNKGLRSTIHSFVVSVDPGVTIIIMGIFLPPTITVDKSEVRRGDLLNISGQSAPQAQIFIIINSDEEIVKVVSTDKYGQWLYKFNSGEIDYGDHSTKGQSKLITDTSPFSQLVFFKVGQKNVLALPPQKCVPKGDLNNDCRVNLVDFSIAAYWYNRVLNSAFVVIEKEKLNGDGKIDLVDFSIMAYYWTG